MLVCEVCQTDADLLLFKAKQTVFARMVGTSFATLMNFALHFALNSHRMIP